MVDRQNRNIYILFITHKPNIRILLLLPKLATSYNQWQKLGEKLLLGQFHVSSPVPLLTMLGNKGQNLRQAMLWVRNIV